MRPANVPMCGDCLVDMHWNERASRWLCRRCGS